MMNRSEQINELATALSKAQGEIEGAVKDKNNPAFRSKYADLGAVWDAIRGPLSKNGLSVVQHPTRIDGGVEVETVLLHSSGQWMSSTLAVPATKNDAHGLGSATTYARRFALSAVCGVSPVDDDGNAASGKINVPGSGPAMSDLADDARREGLTKETRSTYDIAKERKAIKAVVETSRMAMGMCTTRPMLKDWWTENKGELADKLPEVDFIAFKAEVEAKRDDLPATQ